MELHSAAKSVVLKAATRDAKKADRTEFGLAGRLDERLAAMTDARWAGHSAWWSAGSRGVPRAEMLALWMAAQREPCSADHWASQMADCWVSQMAVRWGAYWAVHSDVCSVVHWADSTAGLKAPPLADESAPQMAEH